MKTRPITLLATIAGVAVLLFGGDAEARTSRKPGTAAHYKGLQAASDTADKIVCPLAAAESNGSIHKPGTLAHLQRSQRRSGEHTLPVCELTEEVKGNAKIHKPGTLWIDATASTRQQPVCVADENGRSKATHKPGTQSHFNRMAVRGESSGVAACDWVSSGSERASEVCCVEN